MLSLGRDTRLEGLDQRVSSGTVTYYEPLKVVVRKFVTSSNKYQMPEFP